MSHCKRQQCGSSKERKELDCAHLLLNQHGVTWGTKTCLSDLTLKQSLLLLSSLESMDGHVWKPKLLRRTRNYSHLKLFFWVTSSCEMLNWNTGLEWKLLELCVPVDSRGSVNFLLDKITISPPALFLEPLRKKNPILLTTSFLQHIFPLLL